VTIKIYFQNKTKFQGLGILPTSAEKAPNFQQYISQGLQNARVAFDW
jgi:hypothetical protein